MATSAAAITASVPFVNLSIAAPPIAADCPPQELRACLALSPRASRTHNPNSLAQLSQLQLSAHPFHHRIERVVPMPISAVALAGHRAIVRLLDDTAVPVSRSYLPAAQSALAG